MHEIARALVTGITGAGGSYLAETLAAQGVEVHGFTRWHSRGNPVVPAGARLHEVDLNDLGSVIRGLRVARPDSIFHLASHANVRACFDTPLAVLQNNIMGTANLLEALRLSESQARFLMCSTSEVYGQVLPHEVPIRETNALRPANPYAVSKLTQDALAYTYYLNYKLPVIRTRMFSYFNPRRADLFSTSFARQIVAIERGAAKVLRHGNLESVRTMIDVRDAMSAYTYAMRFGEPGEVYNIGGDVTMTVGEFLAHLIDEATVEIITETDPALLRPTDVTLQIPDSGKFKRATGWRAHHTLAQSVAHLMGELREENGSRDASLAEHRKLIGL